jgi:hypothetical protein
MMMMMTDRWPPPFGWEKLDKEEETALHHRSGRAGVVLLGSAFLGLGLRLIVARRLRRGVGWLTMFGPSPVQVSQSIKTATTGSTSCTLHRFPHVVGCFRHSLKVAGDPGGVYLYWYRFMIRFLNRVYLHRFMIRFLKRMLLEPTTLRLRLATMEAYR